MNLTGEMGFARASTMLRAPRVAVLISPHEWELQARFAIEALCRTWGGSGGVIVAVGKGGDLHPEVMRALRDYDPDYLAPLMLDAVQFEQVHPGVLQLEHQGRRLKAVSSRQRWLKKYGSQLPTTSSVPEEDVAILRKSLNTFDDDGTERVLWVSSWQSESNTLSPTPTASQTVESFTGSTGHPLIDLAVLARAGYLSDAETTVDLASITALSTWRSLLDDLNDTPTTSPFGATNSHLTPVRVGHRRRRSPLIVIGDSADDFALAMLLDRLQGGVAWLPRLVRASPEHVQAAGTALSTMSSGTHEPVPVTSVSIKENEARRRLQRLWDARTIRLVPTQPFDVSFIEPSALERAGLLTLAVVDAWDRRRSIPVLNLPDGASEMMSPPPLDWSSQLEVLEQRWLVEYTRHDKPVPDFTRIPQTSLIVGDQNPHETFIRASRGGIAYERGRWDFVASGASRDGREASPMLRWPSLPELLQIAAARTGCSIRLSDPGRRAQIVTQLWGSIEELAADLTGVEAQLMRAFLPMGRTNGPYDVGKAKGVARAGRGHVTLAALLTVSATWDIATLRRWLDKKCERGVLRRGLLLGCAMCNSVDFVPIDAVGQNNVCLRCGANNLLSHERWRMPSDEPQWFYDLHPAAVEFLLQNGDVPIIAWTAYQRMSRAVSQQWFEFELVDENGKAIVEFDIVGLHDGRLVLGEAKSNGSLDGQNAAAKQRDARKLLDGAARLGADEVCLATAKTWDVASLDAVTAVRSKLGPSIRTIQHVRTDPTARPILLP